MPVKSTAVGVCALLAVLSLPACASGPSSKADVCASFDDLGRQLLEGNGIIGNPLFHKAGDLADVAGRYEGGDADLRADAAALRKIADSDRTSGGQLSDATTHIAALCGHPLGTNALSGH